MYKEILNCDRGTYLAEPLDTWLTAGAHDYAVPEASGSSARVFKYKNAALAGEFQRDVAIKIMRPDKIAYASPLFLQELRIMQVLDGKTGITPLLRSGFLHLSPEAILPAELAPLTKTIENQASGYRLTGEMNLFESSETNQVLKEFEQRIQDNWLPVIIFERRWEDNLYLMSDAGYTRGSFLKNLTMLDVLTIASQICDILGYAHEREIIYLDHKLLHYYWNDLRKNVIMVDWNIGRYLPGKMTPESIQFDLLQFSSRALHHLFTGRQAPGAVAVGQNRPEEIENSPRHFKATYPYDVTKRLNAGEIAFLEKSLDGGFSSAFEMQEVIENLKVKRI
jgi:serine/threonine protein kinase